jgi:peptidoglycan/LPS O-acetylase OafA/YrhL
MDACKTQSSELTQSSEGNYMPQLDGVRGLAVLAVLYSHFLAPYQFTLPLGRTGVMVFFVLSGFLITGILLRCRNAKSGLEPNRPKCLRRFYIRRLLRIFPLYYAALLAAWVLKIEPIPDTLGWHLSYLSNFYVAWRGEWDAAASHLWSLSVEEQFYLIWPFVILWLPQRALLPMIVLSIVFAPLFRWYAVFHWFNETGVRVLTPSCLDALGMGALLAYLRDYHRDSLWLKLIASPWTAAIAAAGTYGTIKLSVMGLWPWLVGFILQDLLIAIAGAWLITNVADGFTGRFGRLLTTSPLLFIGRISYGLYVIHLFVPFYLGRFGIGTGPETTLIEHLLIAMLWTGTTFLLAVLSWFLMERPINNLKRHFPYQDRVASALRLPSATTSSLTAANIHA